MYLDKTFSVRNSCLEPIKTEQTPIVYHKASKVLTFNIYACWSTLISNPPQQPHHHQTNCRQERKVTPQLQSIRP